MTLRLTINGRESLAPDDPMTPLVDLLRERFHLTGAKPVCREGFCGACLVMIDGEPTLSCLTPGGLAEGRDIRTIEGLSPAGRLNPVQNALEAHDAVQCGMCFPGMVMTLTHALRRNAAPSREELRHALTGNTCRCTGYERILDAALSAAGALQGGEP
ncbi:(2Fe-2S)-binding protein [Ancylobacter sp. 6x-1]|uniref:(2Fe-2S)-binding protein n=1 Tax=Ancylobacter crimeensis TaxID=2579147 RepID=A0ABT0DEK0_9HYPH|nr:(2Fe-2S)-binding protein [Ancylobacter crimeensis]MCK0198182.1 (2Fe-2S)-binding protein [Ancylobacter crimeensis]